MNRVELAVLYDDTARAEGAATCWGFSCLLKAGSNALLMDAGADGEALLSNMKCIERDLI